MSLFFKFSGKSIKWAEWAVGYLIRLVAPIPIGSFSTFEGRVRLIDPFYIWEGSDKCESTAGLEELRATLKDTG